jgi:hypothetical protein
MAKKKKKERERGEKKGDIIPKSERGTRIERDVSK